MTYRDRQQVSRSIIILRSGRFYVIDGATSQSHTTVSGELPTGGMVTVPLPNVDAIEEFDDDEIGIFRNRYKQLTE